MCNITFHQCVNSCMHFRKGMKTVAESMELVDLLATIQLYLLSSIIFIVFPCVMDCRILSVVMTGDNFTLLQQLNACISALSDIVCGYSRISSSKGTLQRKEKSMS